MKKCLILVLFLVVKNSIFAQDAHFVQFNKSVSLKQQFLRNANDVFNLNYRSQWVGSLQQKNYFSLLEANYSKTILRGRYDFCSFGLSLSSDNIGVLSQANNTAILSATYMKYFGKDSSNTKYYLAGSLNGGFYTHAIPLTVSNFNSSNFGGSIFLCTVSHRRNNFFNIGFVADHVLQVNKVAEFKTLYSLYPRFSLQSNAEFAIKKKWSIVPTVLYYLQGGANEINGGIALKHDYSENGTEIKSFQLGVLQRYRDDYPKKLNPNALIFNAFWNIANLSLGASYDVSELPQLGNGGFELNIIYGTFYIRPSSGICPHF